MATPPKAMEALRKTKTALSGMKRSLEAITTTTTTAKNAQTKATMALSIGMLRFMGGRLRGVATKADDPLRKELNHIRTVLASIQKRAAQEGASATKQQQQQSPARNQNASEPKRKRRKTQEVVLEKKRDFPSSSKKASKK